MARNLALKVFCLVLSAYCVDAWAIEYHPNRYFLTALASYDVASPTELNSLIAASHAGVLPFDGTVGVRLRLERGFRAPHWTHWIEGGYHFNTVDSSSDLGTAVIQKFSSISVIPVGVTYWFGLTSYMDFGVSLGLGLGLSNRFDIETSAGTTSYTRGLNFIGDTRIQSRLWISHSLAVDLMLSIRYNSPTLESQTGTSIKANLTGVGGVFGVTYAFGGAVGWGRKYVEVIPARPVQPSSQQSEPQAAQPAIRQPPPIKKTR